MPSQLGAILDRGLTDALQRRWLVRDDMSLSLTPELTCVVPVNTDEMLYHMGWRRYMASATIGALAANSAVVQLRIPRGSNIICVIEGIGFFGPATEIVVSGIVSVSDLTLLGAQVRDTLQTATKPGTAIPSQTVAAAPGTGGGGILSTASGAVNPPIFPLVIRPSLNAGVALDGYQFASTTVNQAFDICLTWRERMLNDQENSL